MSSTNCIEQQGIIEEVENGIARVMINSFSACSSCHSKESCGSNDIKQKEIVVKVPENQFKAGEMVMVSLNQSLGYRAVLLAYLLPFFVMLFLLILLTQMGLTETFVGLMCLLFVAIYFFILYLFRNRHKKTFQFTLKKVH